MKKITHIITCILLVLFAAGAKAQLSGAYNVPGSYASIAAAINDLNLQGVNAAVTINVASGHTETAPVGGYTLNTIVGASAANQITFRKNGAGANPLITAYVGGAGTPTTPVQDGVWRFAGTDYVTIDGIDINDPNTSNPSTMEFGYGFFKVNAANGCQNNTIKNCVITLNRINNEAGVGASVEGSRGINMVNAVMGAHTLAITPTVAAGSNSNNKFHSNTIQNCNVGIALIGFADVAPYAFADSGNDIGGTSGATGNTIINYGGGGITSQSEAVITLAQYGINVSYNRINNNTGSGVNHAATLRGIYLGAAVNANVSVNSNTLSLASGSVTNNMTAIEIAASSGTTGAVDINANLITNCTATAATSGGFNGILNSASAGMISISANTFSNNSTAATSGAVSMINNGGSAISGAQININANSVNGFTFTAANSSSSNFISNSGAGANTNLSMSGNNFQNITHGVLGSTSYILINNSGVPAVHNINGNAFINLNINTSGGFTFINSNVSMPSTGVQNINGNSIVTAFNKPGSGGTVYLFSSAASSAGGSISNSFGNNFSNITLGGSTSMGGWNNNDGGSPSVNTQGNTFTNWNIGTGAVTALLVNYNGASSVLGNTISAITSSSSIIGINYGSSGSGSLTTFAYNVITGLNSLAGGSSVVGMVLSGPVTTLVVNNNTISGLSTQAGSGVVGISCTSSSGNISIFKNKIYDLSANNSGATITGMIVSGGTSRVFNNLIGDLRNPIGSGNNIVNGLQFGAATSVSAFFNTVYITGTSSGANFGSSALNISSGTPLFLLRNNIFVNTAVAVGTGSTVAFRKSSVTLANYNTASNGNLFYAGTPSATNVIYYNGTTTYSTLALFKAQVTTSREATSVTENPTFVSTTGSNANFLNISTSVPTQIESGGAAISGITDDFGGNTRNAATPDIGAWEGNFILVDGFAPSIGSLGFNGPTCSLAGRTATASLTDASGVASGGLAPRIYYKVNAGAYTSVGGTLTAGTASAGVWSFNLAYTAVLADVVTYYLVAQDASGNLVASPSAGFAGTDVNTVTTPPTAPPTYTVYQLNGVYTIGSTGTFTSLTAAANVYNLACLAGPVTFSLVDATYSTSETFPVTFLNNVTASATNSLLIKPATSATVIGSNATAIFRINGGDFIKVDGSNNGTTSQNLTFENTNTAGTCVMSIGNSSASDSGSDNAITNCIITGNTGTTTVGGILLSSGITLGGIAEISNNRITITGNTITKAQNGIFANGNATSTDLNWNISRNRIGSTVAAEKMGFRGIAVQNAQSFSVMSNTIIGVNGASSTTSQIMGLLVGALSTNGTVSANVINDIKSTYTSGAGSTGLYFNLGTPTANIVVYNNAVSDIASYGSTGVGANSNAGGIVINNGGGLKIYHNSVYLNTNQTLATGLSMALNITSNVTATASIDLRNNIFANMQTVGANRYAIYSAPGNTVFSNIDYNVYASNGPNLGFIGSNRALLTDLQAGFGGNTASQTVTPVFTSISDLHLIPGANSAIDNTGTPIAAVTTDIDNQSRSASAPDMGADEFTAPLCTTANGGAVSTTSAVMCSANRAFTLTSTGVSTGSTSSYVWKVSPTSGGTYTNVSLGGSGATPILQSNGSLTYTNNALPTGTYYFILEATCANASLVNASNEVTVTVNSTPTASLIVNNGLATCSGQQLSLNAGTDVGTSFSWSGPGGFASTAQNPTVTATAASSNTGVYTLTVSTASCTAAATSSNISINAYPGGSTVNVTSSAPAAVCAGVSQTLSASGSTVVGAVTLGTQANITTGSINNSGDYPAPYNSYWGGQRMQMLVTAAELTAAGLVAGEISAIQFPVVSAGSYFASAGDQAFKVKMAATSLTSLTSFSPGLPTVSGPVTHTPQVGYNNTHTFAPGSFFWDGTSNIIFETTFSNNLSGDASHAVTQYISPTTYASSIVYRADSQTPAAIEGGTTLSYTAYNARPDFKLIGARGSAYSWSPVAGLSTTLAPSVVATPTISTVYTVVASNNGCNAGPTGTINVAINALPTLTVSGASPICSGQSATLSAAGSSSSYLWSDGSNNSNLIISPSTTTNYTVTGSNALCSAVRIVTLGVSTTPTVTAASTPTAICAGASVTLTASGAASYLWNTGATTTNVAVSPTTTTAYTVTGTTGTCSAAGIVNVSVTPLPNVALSSQTVCAGGTATLLASGATTYVWGDASTANPFIVSPTVNGTYSVTGTSLGCSKTVTADVVISSSLSIGIAASNPSICSGGSTTLTASGVSTYTWTTGENTNTLVVNPTSNTAYTVSGTNSGCAGQGIITVSVNAAPSITVTSAPGNTICAGQTVSLTAQGSYDAYSWLTTTLTASNVTVTPMVNTTYTVSGSNTNGNGCTATQTIAIVSNSLPIVSVSPASPSVCPNTPVSFTASGANSYGWNTGANTNVLNVAPSSNTTYTVTGISLDNCSASTTVAVFNYGLPTITIAQSATAVCISSPATFTASGANTYTWVSGPSTAGYTVNPTVNTTYTVNGTNANGCIGSKTVAVVTNSLPVISIAPATPTICASTTLNLTASGAGTGGTYTWTGGPSTSTYVVSPATNTTYTVTGTNTNNCVSTQLVPVVTNTVPVLNITPAVTQTVCSLAGATFTASGATSYTWSGNASFFANVAVYPTSNTTYTVTGKNAANCISSATVAVTTLTLPLLTLAPANSTLCPGVSATFTAGGANTYTWVNNASTTNTATYAISGPTSYTVRGTGPNGCSTSTSVIVFTNPSPIITVAASDQTVCALSPVTFTASGAGTYSWNTTATGSVVTVNPANSTSVYTVTGTDAVTGCATSETVSVATNSLPAIAITPASTVICRNTSVGLTASGALSYAWSHNGSINTSVNVTPTTTTTYSVVGTDAVTGCTNTGVSVVTVNQLPTVAVSPSSATICSIDGSVTFTASGAVNYVWTPGTGSETFVATPSVATTYTVIGTDANNCSNRVIVGVDIDPCTGIKTNSFSGNVVSVYPNPSTGVFTAKFDFEGTKTVAITNAVGQLITETTTTSTTESFDLSGMAKGVYFVRVSTKNASGNYKIIIE